MNEYHFLSTRTVRVNVDSRDKISGTSGNFRARLKKRLNGIIQAKVVNVVIPMSFYQIDDTSDSLNMDYGGANYDATLTHGNYEVNDLMVLINTAFDALVGAGNIVFAYDNATGLVSITGAAAFQFNPYVGDSQLGENILGFYYPAAGANPYVTAGAGTVTAVHKYHGAARIDKVHLIIPELFNSAQFCSTHEVLNEGCVATIPVDYQIDQINYTPTFSQQIVFDFRQPKQMDYIDIKFVAQIDDETYHIVNFNGHEVSIDLDMVQIGEV